MKAKCCDRCAKLYRDEELKSELVLMRETGKKIQSKIHTRPVQGLQRRFGKVARKWKQSK